MWSDAETKESEEEECPTTCFCIYYHPFHICVGYDFFARREIRQCLSSCSELQCRFEIKDLEYKISYR